MNRRLALGAAGALGVATAAVAAWQASRPAPDTTPYAAWRNGIIVDVRNCTAPADDAARLRCAALYCAQAVTEKLTNAQQTEVRITRYVHDAADGRFHVAGTLDQYLDTNTLPHGFTCTMARWHEAAPVFLFARGESARGD